MMTEADWWSCQDPTKLLRAAKFRSHARRSRLFAAACGRCLWPRLVDPRSRRAVEVAERHADGAATDAELRTASLAAHVAHRELHTVLGKVGACIEWAAAFCADPNPFHAATRVSSLARNPRTLEVGRDDYRMVPCAVTRRRGPLVLLGRWEVQQLDEYEPSGAEPAVQVELARCIFPPLGRATVFDPAHRTEAAVALARGMYGSRNFSPAPRANAS